MLRFKGDVRIQILTVKGVTRIRIESASRRGGLDFGENARMVTGYDADFARRLAQSFWRDIKLARPYTYREWSERSVKERIV